MEMRRTRLVVHSHDVVRTRCIHNYLDGNIKPPCRKQATRQGGSMARTAEADFGEGGRTFSKDTVQNNI
jgi:hypothetical protein